MTRVKQKRALETRATLLATATALVEQHGYHALRVEQVVADAGVAKGTFFKHFGDKDGLMQVLIAHARDEVVPPSAIRSDVPEELIRIQV